MTRKISSNAENYHLFPAPERSLTPRAENHQKLENNQPHNGQFAQNFHPGPAARWQRLEAGKGRGEGGQGPLSAQTTAPPQPKDAAPGRPRPTHRQAGREHPSPRPSPQHRPRPDLKDLPTHPHIAPFPRGPRLASEGGAKPRKQPSSPHPPPATDRHPAFTSVPHTPGDVFTPLLRRPERKVGGSGGARGGRGLTERGGAARGRRGDSAGAAEVNVGGGERETPPPSPRPPVTSGNLPSPNNHSCHPLSCPPRQP